VTPSPDSRRQAPALQPGDLVAGRYRLEASIRSAARSSDACAARARRLARRHPPRCGAPGRGPRPPVAVKVLCTGEPCEPARTSDPLAGEPFLRAAAAAGRLTRPVLARVYDAATEQWPAPGRTSVRRWGGGVRHQRVGGRPGPRDGAARGRPVRPGTACRLAAAAAEALESAHARGWCTAGCTPATCCCCRTAGQGHRHRHLGGAARSRRAGPAHRGPARTGRRRPRPHRPAVRAAHRPVAGRRDAAAVLRPAAGAQLPGRPAAAGGWSALGRCGPVCRPQSTTWCSGGCSRRRDHRAGQRGGAGRRTGRHPPGRPAAARRSSAARPPSSRGRGVAVVGGLLVGAARGWRLDAGRSRRPDRRRTGDLFSDDAPAARPPPAPAPSPAVPVVLPAGAVTDFDPPPGAAPRAPTRCRTPSTVTRGPCGGPSATGAPPSAVSSRGSACWSTWRPDPGVLRRADDPARHDRRAASR
jgi:hypothetical protein